MSYIHRYLLMIQWCILNCWILLLILKETYRVLKSGSYALFHHSNNTLHYKVSFATGRSGRNYMSADIFAYLAYRSGFEIVESRTLDWSGAKNLDCITLLRKAN